MTDRSTKPKRARLSNKQSWFFNNVFVANQTVEEALSNLHIRPSTFQRWLTKPIFVQKLRMYLNQFNLQARMELARTAPQAISGLAFLSNKSLRHKEVRQACNDILSLHVQLAKNISGSKRAQDGVSMDNFGVILEQFGVTLDNNGVITDKLGNKNTPQNRILTANNSD